MPADIRDPGPFVESLIEHRAPLSCPLLEWVRRPGECDLRTPYTSKCSSYTRRISPLSHPSRRTRAGARYGSASCGRDDARRSSQALHFASSSALIAS